MSHCISFTMGFFKSDDNEVKLPPNKAKRQVCWDSRDALFACLDKNNIDDSLNKKELGNVQSKCGAELKGLEASCVASWVLYFQQKRFNDLTKQRYIAKLEAEGAQPLPFTLQNRK